MALRTRDSRDPIAHRDDRHRLLQGPQRQRPPDGRQRAYNITPDIGGFYFNKISCFCFDEQHLGPNETAELPVVFFVDPDLDKDPNMKSVDTMTLSYTFFAVKARPAVSADANKGEAAPKL